jgi:hypothetical protein
MFLIKKRASRYALLTILIAWAFGLPTTNAQTFDLSDATALIPVNVKAAAAEYKGRKAVLITRDVPKDGVPKDGVFKDGFALLKGVDFQDGTIEGEIALKITAPPGAPGVRRMPGFIGIAFRARPDASRYDLFYVRPGNSTSTINRCGIVPCSTPMSPNRAGINCAASGRGFTRPGPI